MSCDHVNFRADVEVHRIEDSAVWYANLKVRCEGCGQEMQFIGFPMGMSPAEPMINVSGTELHIPFRPYDQQEIKRRMLDEDPIGFRISRT